MLIEAVKTLGQKRMEDGWGRSAKKSMLCW